MSSGLGGELNPFPIVCIIMAKRTLWEVTMNRTIEERKEDAKISAQAEVGDDLEDVAGGSHWTEEGAYRCTGDQFRCQMCEGGNDEYCD